MGMNKVSAMRRGEKAFSMILTFCLALFLWMLLSGWGIHLIGYYDPFKLAGGIVAALIITLTMHWLLIPRMGEKMLLKFRRWLLYVLWESRQIVLAAIDVALRILGIRAVDPRIIEFETTLRSDFALTTLANSITLTPGTVTIDVEPERGKYVVHAIGKEPADSLTVDQTMQRKVAYVFMEE